MSAKSTKGNYDILCGLVCFAAIGVGVYIICKKCGIGSTSSTRSEHYEPRQNARYCPAGKVWCDSAHTCVPQGKCIDLCMFENMVWCHKNQRCIKPHERCM